MQITCEPLTLPLGVVGGVNGCENGDELTSINSPNCTVTCASTHSRVVQGCSNVRSVEASVSRHSDALRTIVTVSRSGTGMIGDDSANDTIPCFDGIVLSAATQPRCRVQCREGFIMSGSQHTPSNVVMTEATWSNIFSVMRLCVHHTYFLKGLLVRQVRTVVSREPLSVL